MFSRKLPLLLLTDNSGLFNTVTKGRGTTEKRPMIDLESIREAYKRKEIDNIALIRSEFNPADGLTKLNANSALNNLTERGTISHSVEQFISTPPSMYRSTPCTPKSALASLRPERGVLRQSHALLVAHVSGLFAAQFQGLLLCTVRVPVAVTRGTELSMSPALCVQ